MRVSTEKLEHVQHLRALAAIAVVLFHAGGAVSSTKYQGNTTISQFTGGLDSGVDLFFIISGFVLSIALLDREKLSFPTFLVGRVLRIYPMAILTTLIFVSSGFLVMGYSIDLLQVLSSLTLLPSPVPPIPIVLWTLKQELLFYGIFSLSILNRSLGLTVFSLWSLLSLWLGYSRTDEAWLMGWLFHVQNFEFFVGFLAYLAWRKNFLPHKVSKGLFLVLLALFLAFSVFGAEHIASDRVRVIILSLICGPLLLSAAKVRSGRSDTWMFLGVASYSIYLIHFFFLALLNKIAARLGLPDLVDFILISGGSVLAGCVYYLLFERQFERLRVRITRQHNTRAEPNQVVA